MKSTLILILFFVGHFSIAQNMEAYRIYNSKGKKVSYKKMMKALKSNEIVFFGELHDDPIAHWLEFEVTKALAKFHSNKLTLGFEMIEADQQVILNDYLADQLKEKNFEDSLRKWPNYKTDYKPLIIFAKNNKMSCVASNIPRRYASKVFKEGRGSLESLSADEKAFLCPINFEIDTTLSQYQLLLEMGMHNPENFVAAQAIKDATMAQFIHKYWTPGTTFIHFNGAFHTDFHQGILWYLQKYRPNLKSATISTVQQDDVTKFNKENIGQADFIIVTPTNMTKTH